MTQNLKKIDARNSTDADGNSYFVVFCARESDNPLSKPGHAFVVWGIEDNNARMSSQTSFGFYPKEGDELKAVFSTVPGLLVDEAMKQTPSSLFTARLIVQVNRKQFESSQKQINIWSTSDYNLYAKNCIHFVRDIAIDLEFFPPSVDAFELPSAYLQELMESVSQ